MIQLNLLPDVKLEYLKAHRARRLVVSISFIVTAASVAILILLFIVDLAEKKQISDLNRSISNDSSNLKSKPGIGKILTIQNQLQSLTALHVEKPAADRVVDTYLNEMTPVNASITDVTLLFTNNSGTITGLADTVATVNEYVDTLKFTTYSIGKSKTTAPAFSSVVLSAFTVNAQSTNSNDQVNYTISFNFTPQIFNDTEKIVLNVPTLVTTRSELDQPPTSLFRAKPIEPTIKTDTNSTSSSGGQ